MKIIPRWKASMFLFTSIFLLCCEMYGWTGSDEDPKQKIDPANNNETINEEDFPTLREWLDDRDVLYKERLRYFKMIC